MRVASRRSHKRETSYTSSEGEEHPACATIDVLLDEAAGAASDNIHNRRQSNTTDRLSCHSTAPTTGILCSARLRPHCAPSFPRSPRKSRTRPLPPPTRSGPLHRVEAEIHNAHGLADYRARELDVARHEFDRAIAADPSFVDGLYNAASTAALEDRLEEVVVLLRRAAHADPRRVQGARRRRQRPAGPAAPPQRSRVPGHTAPAARRPSTSAALSPVC